MDQHLQQPDRGLLRPQWCQSQLIPALGGGTCCHRFLLPRQYLALTPGLGHSTWAAWLKGARGWPGTCRPALSAFLRGLWPGQGRVTSIRGGEQRATPAGLGATGENENTRSPQTLLCAREAAHGGRHPAPALLSPFLSPAQAWKGSIPVLSPPPVPGSLSQPQASLGLPMLPRWGSYDSGVWVGAVSL